MKESRFNNNGCTGAGGGKSDADDEIVVDAQAVEDDSCSLSDYDDETELSNGSKEELHHLTAVHLPPKTSAEDSSQSRSTAATSKELPFSDIQALFSALDTCNFETVGFREFCALVFLLAAMEDNQLLQCLYQHGVLLFDIIGGG